MLEIFTHCDSPTESTIFFKIARSPELCIPITGYNKVFPLKLHGQISECTLTENFYFNDIITPKISSLN